MKKWMIKHPVISILLIALFSSLMIAWIVCAAIFRIDFLVYSFLGLLALFALLGASIAIYFVIITDDNDY